MEVEARFLLHSYNYNPSVTFTLEIGDGGDNIAFLNLLILLLHQNNTLLASFQVYRKNAFPRVPIQQASLHPNVHKYATVNSAIHGLMNLSLSSEAREKKKS